MFGAAALAIFILLAGGFLLFRILRKSRRRRLLQEGLPSAQVQILANCVPLYPRLSSTERSKLEALVRVFLHEKNFEACGGLTEVTEEMRLTIAGNACLMVLGHSLAAPFPGLHSVLLYPAGFSIPKRRLHPWADPLFPEQEHVGSVRLGESWESGSIVLSWADVVHGRDAPDDGFNLVIHEFAHQLDGTSGNTDGVPLLENGEDYATWQDVFLAGYERLQDELENGGKPLLDPYGATAPEEFFAVATEAFFEVPKELQVSDPKLYEELVGYFQLNPARW